MVNVLIEAQIYKGIKELMQCFLTSRMCEGGNNYLDYMVELWGKYLLMQMVLHALKFNVTTCCCYFPCKFTS